MIVLTGFYYCSYGEIMRSKLTIAETKRLVYERKVDVVLWFIITISRVRPF